MGGLLFEKANTFLPPCSVRGDSREKKIFLSPVSAPPCPVSAFLEIFPPHVCSGFVTSTCPKSRILFGHWHGGVFDSQILFF